MTVDRMKKPWSRFWLKFFFPFSKGYIALVRQSKFECQSTNNKRDAEPIVPYFAHVNKSQIMFLLTF